jgi:hypothetical protein
MKKTIKFLSLGIGLMSLFIMLSPFFSPEVLAALPSWLIDASGAATLAGFSTGVYYDKNGQLMSQNGDAARSVAGAADFVNTLGAISPACGPKANYVFPDQFTLVADNSAGLTATTFKFTQADNMTEAAIGSIGTAWFAVQELPFGNGTIPKEDGTDIFGAESLARSLQSYGIRVHKIQATGTYLTTVPSIVMNAWRGSLAGQPSDTWKLDVDTTNASQTPTLVRIGDIDLTSNVSFNVIVPAGETLNLTFFNKGIIPYI